MCTKEKKYDFLEVKQITCTHNAATEMVKFTNEA